MPQNTVGIQGRQVGGYFLAKARSGAVGALKFLVFIVCLIGIPIVARELFGMGGSFEMEMGLCMGAWVVALILQWVIGKAFDKPAQEYHGQTQHGGSFQPAAPVQQYQRGHHHQEYDNVGVREPQVFVGTGPVVQETRYTKGTSFLQKHICRYCGGPINLKTKKCEYCGAWN